ncbi:MAG: hypothetical protein AAF938_27645, partial [Myxococcota bacterium]
MADDPHIAENQRLKAELVRISAQIEALAKENAALKVQIERLQRQLGQNSSNSNKPPLLDVTLSARLAAKFDWIEIPLKILPGGVSVGGMVISERDTLSDVRRKLDCEIWSRVVFGS